MTFFLTFKTTITKSMIRKYRPTERKRARVHVCVSLIFFFTSGKWYLKPKKYMQVNVRIDHVLQLMLVASWRRVLTVEEWIDQLEKCWTTKKNNWLNATSLPYCPSLLFMPEQLCSGHASTFLFTPPASLSSLLLNLPPKKISRERRNPELSYPHQVCGCKRRNAERFLFSSHARANTCWEEYVHG